MHKGENNMGDMDDMDTGKDKKVVLDFWDKWNTGFKTGSFDEALDLLSDDLSWEMMGNPSTYGTGVRTKAEMVELFKWMLKTFPEVFRVMPKSIISEDGKVALEAESYAEHKNGKVYSNRYHWLFEVCDGKIRAGREYADMMHVMDVCYGGSAPEGTWRSARSSASSSRSSRSFSG